jgi:hypothetical protein
MKGMRMLRTQKRWARLRSEHRNEGDAYAENTEKEGMLTLGTQKHRQDVFPRNSEAQNTQTELLC